MFRTTIIDSKTSIVVTATIFTLFKANTKESTKGGAAEGRDTSSVVAGAGRHLCILALNRVNIVAITTILVLPVGVIGHHVRRHWAFMLHRRSGNACGSNLVPFFPELDYSIT